MQDVIFNGSDSKEALSMAEVTITFDNSNRFFNIDFPELSITRKIFRSGESEYLLNKNLVRLKDILDLLMGTGIGAESYSLVAQGKIDLILSSRPEDRRLVFDEASGITKYKAQKRETLRRLEETDQNLLRVNDIVTEVKRQIGSLERQANKARRYKEVFEELKAKEIQVAMVEKERLKQEQVEIVSQLGLLETQEAELLSSIKEEESKIAGRQEELRALEDAVMSVKNQILTLDNSEIRNNQRLNFNQEKIEELEEDRKYLESQLKQVEDRLVLNREKFDTIKKEYDNLKGKIEGKRSFLDNNQKALDNIIFSIKLSLEKISQAKKDIIEIVTKTVNAKNEINDALSRRQIFLAREKRLQIEQAKVKEEKSQIQESLDEITKAVVSLDKTYADLNLKTNQIRNSLEEENLSLANLNNEILDLEKQVLALESQKEFIDKLKNRYQDISESMNAVIYLDRLPNEKLNGLVIKVKNYSNLSDEDRAYFEPASYKLSGEAKPIELDTTNIDTKITHLKQKIELLRGDRLNKEERLDQLKNSLLKLQEELRSEELDLANKKASQQAVTEQFNRLKQEEEVISIELEEIKNDLSMLEGKLKNLNSALSEAETEQKRLEDSITTEEDNISVNSASKEELLVVITQTKTELEALDKRIDSDVVTLKMAEDTCRQDEDNLMKLKTQIKEGVDKREALTLDINQLKLRNDQIREQLATQKDLLRETEGRYQKITLGSSDVVKKIESDRKSLDSIKDSLYALQIKNKDLDFNLLSLKERIQQSYKIELEDINEIPQDTTLGIDTFKAEIEKLKEKLDSYGTVNLVAIEEYDELKKRYDFLIQQQSDLTSAKQALQEAILKINRTTKKMFLETFEKVKEEFRNYFRLLFNGGDAQLFLIDENDPLESGIEIICRPPGKKLQNVLLLSGGEKSMSAIALIFAIFKVKPSPFCILDEIDAALDEANVDRFSRILHEFVRQSQFIVITHNKKTISNAYVMYGITMEESGVSKIVSVKFAENKEFEEKEPEAVIAAQT
jgi:chromosome segregation protein